MADIGKAPEGFPRRMQAARALAGLTIDQLAEALKDEPGLSARSLRDIENGTANVQWSRQRAIIEACGLPADFATTDLWLLEALAQGLDKLPRQDREQSSDDILIGRAFTLLAAQPDDETGVILERLAERIQEVRADLQRQLDELSQPQAEVVQAARQQAQGRRRATQARVAKKQTGS